jgi:hypothetical protein
MVFTSTVVILIVFASTAFFFWEAFLCPSTHHCARARERVTFAPPVRKIGTYDSPRNRMTVVYSYGDGPKFEEVLES